MSTYRELIYMVLDQIKLTSDDSYYESEHVAFLLDKNRALLLKQRYSDVRKEIPLSNYSIFAVNMLSLSDNSSSIPNTKNFTVNGTIVKSYEKLPTIIQLGGSPIPVKLYNDFTAEEDLIFKGEFQYATPERLKYTGENKWLKQFIYYTLGPDNHLYLKWTALNLNLSYACSTLMAQAIISSPKDIPVDEYNTITNYMDRDYPLEESLIPPLLDIVIKELLGATYRPQDNQNNTQDDLANVLVK